MRTWRLAVSALAAALIGCGGGGSTAPAGTGGTPSGGGTGGTGGSTSASINVDDNSFTPSATTVKVATTVTWTWIGSGTHNVTFQNAALGMSDNLGSGGTFQKAFPNTGTFTYQCTNHVGMNGTVTVSP